MFSGKSLLKNVERGQRGCFTVQEHFLFFVVVSFLFTVLAAAGYSKEHSKAPADEAIVIGLKKAPDIFPIYSDVYSGGVQFDITGKLYIWDGQTKMEAVREDVPVGKNALRVIPAPSGEWFGWGIHPFPKKYVNMVDYTNGRLSLYLNATSNATIFKIGVKNSAAIESCVEIVPGAYGFQYDGKWHALSIPFKDFVPKINFKMINVYFMFISRDRIKFGSEYELDEVLWEK